MRKVFILARGYSECLLIAQLAGLGPSEWKELCDFNTQGCRGNVLLSTAGHCWSRERGAGYATTVTQVITTRDLKAVLVPCPGDWEASGYRLPPGWDEPYTYKSKVVLHPPQPRLTWARRLRQFFGGPQ